MLTDADRDHLFQGGWIVVARRIELQEKGVYFRGVLLTDVPRLDFDPKAAGDFRHLIDYDHGHQILWKEKT